MMKRKSLALALAAPICWGSTFTLAKPAVTHFPPLQMMLFAYLFTAIVLFFTSREKIATPWPRAMIISLCCVTLQGALLFWGMRGVEATTANLVLQTQVPAAVFLGWLIMGDQLTYRKLSGMVIALAGVAIIIGLPQHKPELVPVAMIIISGFIWALGQVLVQKWSLDQGAQILKLNSFYGVPQLFVATAIIETGQWKAIMTASPLEWLNLAFVCIIGFYVAYILWFKLLRQVPMNEAAPYVLLMTPVGLLTAVIFLGERMSVAQIAGALVLLVGLAILNGIGAAPSKRKSLHLAETRENH